MVKPSKMCNVMAAFCAKAAVWWQGGVTGVNSESHWAPCDTSHASCRGLCPPAREEQRVLGGFAEPGLGGLQGRKKGIFWLKGWCSCVCQEVPWEIIFACRIQHFFICFETKPNDTV